jgi:hypothetical protein
MHMAQCGLLISPKGGLGDLNRMLSNQTAIPFWASIALLLLGGCQNISTPDTVDPTT